MPKVVLLSKKQEEVFVLIAKGFSSKEVAEALDKSPKTIEKSRGVLYRKLGVTGPAVGLVTLKGVQ